MCGVCLAKDELETWQVRERKEQVREVCVLRNDHVNNLDVGCVSSKR